MLYGDYVTDTLNARHERCLHPLRQRRTLQRWRTYPAVTGKTMPEITAILADGHHPEHNRVAAAVLDAHHRRRDDHDDDAMVLLLVAARPLVLSLDPRDIDRDSRATLWNAVGWRLETMTVTEITDNPTPFLVMLLGRIKYLKAGSPSRRDAAATRFIIDPDTFAPAYAVDIVNQVIDRAVLDHLRQQPDWPDFARWLRTGQAASGVHHQWAARTRRQLARAVGYAA